MTVYGVVVGVVLLALLLAIFPPRRVPRWWRHHTRPLRRLVRPRRYRTW